MADITWPTDLRAARFSMRLAQDQRVYGSAVGGVQQAVDMLRDCWFISLEVPVRKHVDARALEAFIRSFRGATRTVGLWHMGKPNLLGTLSGSRALAADAAQGAASISVTAGAGQTLKAGDMLGLDGLVVEVSADAAESGGTITATLTNRLRRAVASGEAITLASPLVECRLISMPEVLWRPGLVDTVAMDFMEVIS